ncbi:MAG: MBL fold metallo-hydrolase, partial [Huintestinicola sp.]
GEKGDVLIDTGREEYRDNIETWLLNYNIKLIILTHGHAESIQNAGYFSELYGAPIMISPYDMRIARDNSAREHYITNPLGYLYKGRTEMTRHMHMNRFDPKIYAEEGMDLSGYGIDGVIVDLQGHTKGSIGVLCRSAVGFDLYAGDAVSNVLFPMFPMTAESPARAREALERIVTIAPDRILCGQGKPICFGDKGHKFFIDRL